MPAKPLILETVRVDDDVEPALRLNKSRRMLIPKSGVALVLNVAVSIVSGIGVGDPLDIVTHVPLLTLVPLQPVW